MTNTIVKWQTASGATEREMQFNIRDFNDICNTLILRNMKKQ